MWINLRNNMFRNRIYTYFLNLWPWFRTYLISCCLPGPCNNGTILIRLITILARTLNLTFMIHSGTWQDPTDITSWLSPSIPSDIQGRLGYQANLPFMWLQCAQVPELPRGLLRMLLKGPNRRHLFKIWMFLLERPLKSGDCFILH